MVYVMLCVVIVWWVTWIAVTIGDIKKEKVKIGLLNAGKLDPFHFTGERAKKEFFEYIEKHPEVRNDKYVQLILENTK